MTLIYTSASFLATNSGSPVRCTSPIAYCPEYVINEQTKNVNTCQVSGTPSLFMNNLADCMKNVKLRLSLEDVSKCVGSREKRSYSTTTISMGGRDDSDRVKPLKDIRSILKKSASADAVSIAQLRDNLLATRRLSISLSDTNLSQHNYDDEEEATLPERPRSPSKNVTFADDNNLSLVEVHNFIPSSENLDQWQFASCYPTNFRMSKVSGNRALAPSAKGRIVRRPVELLLCFKEPCDNPDFAERFEQRCVALERCATRDRTVTGIVIVKNIEYEKHVSVRYTVDGWKTTADVEACYVPNSNDKTTDRFSFTLSLPKSYKGMEFAVRYKTASAEYWDNNYNRNYKVKDALTPF